MPANRYFLHYLGSDSNVSVTVTRLRETKMKQEWLTRQDPPF